MTRISSSRRKQRVVVFALVGLALVVLCGLLAGWDSVAAIVALCIYVVGMWIAIREDVAELPGETESADAFDAGEFDDG